jgi:hypothetical protein
MSGSATLVFPRLQGDQVPAGSRPILEKVQKGFGFIPNLFAAFSNSPTSPGSVTIRLAKCSSELPSRPLATTPTTSRR